jgi:hypothetical protein
MASIFANHDDEQTPFEPGRPRKADPRSDASDEPSAEGEPSAEEEETSLDDWIEAENSRPTLPDETADGLNDLDEEVRHQAEDFRPDISRRD